MKPKKKHIWPVRLVGQMVSRYYEHDVARDSAALTYYLLFAIFPLLIFISVLVGAMKLDVEGITRFLTNVAPPAVAGIVKSYLTYVTGNVSRQLLWFSLVFSIWFPMRATSCLMHSLRKAFGYGRPSSIWGSVLRTLIFAVLLIFTIALTLLLSMVGRRALHLISSKGSIPEWFITAWSYLRFVLMALVMAFMLAALYMLAVGRMLPAYRVLPGIVISLAAWLLVSMAFSYYVEHFARYAVLYGSIATIVVVLLWLYWSGAVLIMGAELNGAILELTEHKKTPTDREGL